MEQRNHRNQRNQRNHRNQGNCWNHWSQRNHRNHRNQKNCWYQTNKYAHHRRHAAVQTLTTNERIFGTGAPTIEEQASQTLHQDDRIASRNSVC